MDLKVIEVSKEDYTRLAVMEFEETMIISAMYAELENNASLSEALQNVVYSFNEFNEMSGKEFETLDKFKVRKILKSGEEKGYCKLVKQNGNSYSLYYL
ncbi:hypothetical protein ACWGKR_24540 [Bacillus thuringiensis]|uniref:hypothetical protein n=1 Tax=Bacillus thuringiensis TaxID=1428 RepID=UPI0035E1D684